MFVRRKPNKSGTTSVQVVAKSRGSYRVVKSFGTGKTEAELLSLECKERVYVNSLKGPSLFGSVEDDRVEDFVGTISNGQIQVIGPELVFGSLYDHIGFGAIKEDMFRHLVVSRLFSPGSKLRTVDYLLRYQSHLYEISSVYRFLDRLCDRRGGEGIKSQVEQIAYAHTKKVVGGKIDAVFYDMTTLYFEASEEDDLRRCGFSKDGKHSNPQIFLGVLVGSGGNPIGYDIFEGNIFEGDTLIPVLDKMTEKYGLGKPVVIADAGLLSKRNLRALSEAGYEYVLGARVKNEPNYIKDRILAIGLDCGQTAVIMRNDGSRLIVSKTERRAAKDRFNRERGLRKLQRRLGSGRLTKSNINNRGYNKYLRMDGEVHISIDMGKFEADAAWDGIKGYVTNTMMGESEVIENYSNLWYIERAFRMSKTDLRVRPIYHRLKNRIDAHICICFTAYAILLELERILKQAQCSITIDRARELTKNMYQLTYTLPESRRERTAIMKMDEDQQTIYDLVKKHCLK